MVRVRRGRQVGGTNMTLQTRQSPLGDHEHVVQFYDRDGDLIRAVGAYLAEAIRAGDATIVIATEKHRLAFQAELVDAGIDVARGATEGALVWLDAAETLATFVRDGQADPVAFRTNVGEVVRGALRHARSVRAYGEMVGLLWDAGDVLGAIEVEKLWNELGRELNFSLWCGYQARGLAGDEHAHALHEVCHLHTAVVEHATARFRAGPHAPFAARRFVTAVLECGPGDEPVPAADAQLIVSELASNAVLHAGSPFSVSVRWEGPVIRISVQDSSPHPPMMRDASTGARSGRGLRLVDAVASNWGVEQEADGKTVWAELAVP